MLKNDNKKVLMKVSKYVVAMSQSTHNSLKRKGYKVSVGASGNCVWLYKYNNAKRMEYIGTLANFVDKGNHHKFKNNNPLDVTKSNLITVS